MNNLDVIQAMNNILKVVRAYKGTADEHELLKASMDKISEYVSKALKKEKEDLKNLNGEEK